MNVSDALILKEFQDSKIENAGRVGMEFPLIVVQLKHLICYNVGVYDRSSSFPNQTYRPGKERKIF